jgi:hypothetical protein
MINPEEVSIYRRMRKAVIQELRPKTPVEWILVNEFVNGQFSAMRYGTWQAAVMQFSAGEGLSSHARNAIPFHASVPPCSGQSRPSLAVAANAASLDRLCARRLRDRWPGWKNGPRRGRTKEWTYSDFRNRHLGHEKNRLSISSVVRITRQGASGKRRWAMHGFKVVLQACQRRRMRRAPVDSDARPARASHRCATARRSALSATVMPGVSAMRRASAALR